MPYDQNLAQRIRAALNSNPDIVEKKMFGGVGFMLHGNMACGVQGNGLIVRVGPDQNDSALSRPFTRSFMGVPGKPMAGWVVVEPGGIAADQDLQEWIKLGIEYTMSLPEKP